MECLQLARGLGARRVEGWASYVLGVIAFYEGDSRDGTHIFEGTETSYGGVSGSA